MTLNSVTLTVGMRNNLITLQASAALLDRTQSRLSTGKKVNSAIDNPTSFFAAQALTSRASIIAGLKDGMGQAIQTIQAADKGVKAITSFVEQAKGIAHSALSASTGGGQITETITLNSVQKSDTITVGGIALTAGPTAVITVYNFWMLHTQAGITAGQTIEVGGATFTAVTDPGEVGDLKYLVDGNQWNNAARLAESIESHFGDAYTAYKNPSSNSVIIEAGTSALDANTVKNAPPTIILDPRTSESQGPLGTDEFDVTGDDASAAQSLSNLINNTSAITAQGYSAAASNGVVTISKDSADVAEADVVVSNSTRMEEAFVEGASELESLQVQYNTVLTQLSDLAADGGYKGKNLLRGDALSVKFEGGELDVAGFSATASGLNLVDADWTMGGDIDADLDLLDTALSTLRMESSKMSGNLTIITVRQDFSTDMINTLTEGADKLTLADTDEEGANMLMLQTRQSLGTTALSLSAQAAQAVLNLFR